ncbi:hypothetical protein ACHAWF_005088 [Thalassiosira exigua]
MCGCVHQRETNRAGASCGTACNIFLSEGTSSLGTGAENKPTRAFLVYCEKEACFQCSRSGPSRHL